jgi:hypothetical protein
MSPCARTEHQHYALSSITGIVSKPSHKFDGRLTIPVSFMAYTFHVEVRAMRQGLALSLCHLSNVEPRTSTTSVNLTHKEEQ